MSSVTNRVPRISVCSGPVTAASRARDDHVDFGPDAEVVEVDARLDREAGAGQQPPVVVRFVVVHVDAVAVHRLAEAVAGAVQDLVAVAGARAAPTRPRGRPRQPRSSCARRAARCTSAIAASRAAAIAANALA